MSVDFKPARLPLKEKSRIELLSLDSSYESGNKIRELTDSVYPSARVDNTGVVHISYVQGGRGNRRLAVWCNGREHLSDNELYCVKNNKKVNLNKVEEDIMLVLKEGLLNDLLYDYRPNNKDYPKEWDNIKWGLDIWKVSKKEWFGFWSVFISFVGMIGYLISLIF